MFVCYLSHMILITLLSLENVADSRSVVVGTCYKMFSWLKQPLRPAAALTLNIEVDDQRTFTTRERITGRLTIKPVVDTPLDKLEIKLQGISRAYGRRIVPHAPNARTVTTAHRFLELTQPDLAHCSPEDKVFRSGRQYIFPFEFVIPDRMLPATCRHAVESPGIHELHTSMPPSFGDQQPGEATDYAPRKASVKYCIIARAYKSGEPTGHSKEILLACGSKRIRFVPSDVVPTPVPIHIDQVGGYMPLRQLWAKRLGNLTVTSMQAPTFQIRKVHSGMWHSGLSGQVKLELLFIPASNGAKPPEQVELSGIFRTETSSAVSPLSQLPSTDPWLGPELDRHTAPSVILSSRAIGNISWKRISAAHTESDEKCPSYEVSPSFRAPKSPHSNPQYSAEIVVSLTAAIGFSLVPIFHSCLISRTYSIDLRLSTRMLTFGSFSAMRLKVPVVVAYEPTDVRRDSTMFSAGTADANAVGRCDSGPRPDERLTWEEMAADGLPSYELSST
jgi:hypothetical protein